jgi:PAS domain S-box-containing protein
LTELSFNIEDILDHMSDGVYVCDRERRIVYWSKAAERITGWTAADVVGRRCLDDVLNHVDKDGHRLCGEEYCPLHRSMITGIITRVPLIVYALAKDGRRIPMHVTAAPLRNAAGEVVGGVETFRDVTPMLIDMQRAGRIQQQLFQQKLPEDPRLRISAFCMPRDIVGGDYYAIRRIDADRFGFLLADMEGHGVAAALYAMSLNAMWDRLHALVVHPPEFAAAVNEELVRLFESDTTFATAVCGVVDTANGSLRVSGAGGPPGLIIRADGSAAKLTAPGLPLGCMSSVSYQEQSARLSPGDHILFFSDGAIEIHDAANRQLGVDGILSLLERLEYPAQPLSMAVLEQELLKFSNEIRLPDDVTIIEIIYKGAPSETMR